VLTKLGPFFGLGGWEGIHPDNEGIIYLQEDIGGATAPANTLATIDGQLNVPLRRARQPNSFVYRYIPKNPRRLEDGGKLQALQVIIDGNPITFHAADVIGDIIAPAQRKLHTPGTTWPIKWITIHESKAGDTTPFVATTAAKAAGATPFKRPEKHGLVARLQVPYLLLHGDRRHRCADRSNSPARRARRLGRHLPRRSSRRRPSWTR
jgi:hypothetical protein